MLEFVRYCSCGQFRSDGQWTHPARVIDSYELICMIRGSFRMLEDGLEYQLRENTCLLLEPGRTHRGVGPVENVSFFWVHFYAGGLPPVPKQSDLTDQYQMALLFRQLLHYSNTPAYPAEGCDYLVRLLLLELSQHGTDGAGNLIHQAAEWIRVRRGEMVRAADVAAAFGYNGDYLSRAFRKVYGQSLKEYIDRTKMDYIRQLLLTTNDPLQKIAERTGFTDYKYFLKFFRGREDMTPTEFRNAFARTHVNIR